MRICSEHQQGLAMKNEIGKFEGYACAQVVQFPSHAMPFDYSNSYLLLASPLRFTIQQTFVGHDVIMISCKCQRYFSAPVLPTNRAIHKNKTKWFAVTQRLKSE
jgi:hypothetical protein